MTNVQRSKWADISRNCTFCQTYPEMVVQLLYECNHNRAIWNAPSKWAKRKQITFNQENVSLENIIFCNFAGENHKLVNTLILIFKQYIYAMKCKKNSPLFIDTLSRVVQFQKIEYRIAMITKKVANHCEKWKPFIDLLNHKCDSEKV